MSSDESNIEYDSDVEAMLWNPEYAPNQQGHPDYHLWGRDADSDSATESSSKVRSYSEGS